MSLRVTHPEFGEMRLQFSHDLPKTFKVEFEDGESKTVKFHGATIASLVDSADNLIASAMATVYYKDQFSKAEGRRQALKKLQQQLRALDYPGQFIGAVWFAHENRNERN
jgi:hypothetical protein